MGLLDMILGSRHKQPDRAISQGFKTFTEMDPVFTPWSGKIYEQELTRAAIDRFATSCSKFEPGIKGNAKPLVRRAIKTRPNASMTWPKFLKRVASMYEADGTAIIIPTFEDDLETINGFWPLRFNSAEVVDVHGVAWITFQFATGDTAALKLSEVCILNKFQLDSDIFGERNCLDSTMSLIDAQNQAQEAAIKNGAKIRFIASIPGMVSDKDLEKKREVFIKRNFGTENNGGIMVYDQTFSELRQIEPQNYTISSEEMQRITDNVCCYFGINEHILKSDFDENQWGAFYESRCEPFACELGDGLTNMCFSQRQIMAGNVISFSSNRLEYSSNASKRNMIRDMIDRGVMSINEGREILQMPPVPDGDVRVIRGEYLNSAAVSSIVGVQGGGELPMNVSDQHGERDLGGADVFYNDSDAYSKDDFED